METVEERDIARTQATVALASLQKKSTLIENLNGIPPFTGDTSSTSLNDFLDNLDNYGELFEWQEEEQKFALLHRVMGSAAKLIKPHKSKSVAEIRAVLKERYTKHQTPGQIINNFMNFKQLPNMPVQDFYYRAVELSEKALKVQGVPEEVAEASRQAMLHSMLLENLSPDIKRGVITKEPTTPEQILHFALLEEKAIKSVQHQQSHFNVQPQPSTELSQPIACATGYPSTSTTQQQSSELESLKQQLRLLTDKMDSIIINREENIPIPQYSRGRAPNNSFFCTLCNRAGHTANFCYANGTGQSSSSYDNDFAGVRGSDRRVDNANRGRNFRGRTFTRGNNRGNDRRKGNQAGYTSINQQRGNSNNRSEHFQPNRGRNHRNGDNRDNDYQDRNRSGEDNYRNSRGRQNRNYADNRLN